MTELNLALKAPTDAYVTALAAYTDFAGKHQPELQQQCRLYDTLQYRIELVASRDDESASSVVDGFKPDIKLMQQAFGQSLQALAGVGEDRELDTLTIEEWRTAARSAWNQCLISRDISDRVLCAASPEARQLYDAKQRAEIALEEAKAALPLSANCSDLSRQGIARNTKPNER